MCVVSMVMDKYTEDWNRFPIGPNIPYSPQPNQPYMPLAPQIQPFNQDSELKKFQEWLEMAKKYDEKNKEPECESDAKIKKLLEVAAKLGIKEKVAQAIKEVLQKEIE